MSGRPYIIGITGPSCSGKSGLAKALVNQLPETDPLVLSLDSYYHDLSSLHPAEREKRNFDRPEAIDLNLFKNHLQILVSGGEISEPNYDFATHTRLPQSKRISPGNFVIIEGLFVLYWKEIRDFLCTSAFVTLNDHICLSRRLERDTKERGRTPESVMAQYAETVRPMNEKYILPTKTFADIVVNGEDLLERSTAIIMAHISSAIDHNSFNRQSSIINHQSKPGDGK